MAPKATGAVLATSATAAALIGLNPRRDEHHGGDGHRRAEPGQRLEQRAEAEGDDDGLDALVVRQTPIERRKTAKWPVATVML